MSFFCLQRDWKNVLLFAVALATEESEAVEDHICKEQNAHSIYFILFYFISYIPPHDRHSFLSYSDKMVEVIFSYVQIV